MARISGNKKSSSRDFGDTSQLTNWILDSGATCHMTPHISDFILGSLQDTDRYIEVTDRYYVTAKKKGQFQIIICDNNGDPFVATLHNVLLALGLCNRLFLIITLMNLEHTCLYHKFFHGVLW